MQLRVTGHGTDACIPVTTVREQGSQEQQQFCADATEDRQRFPPVLDALLGLVGEVAGDVAARCREGGGVAVSVTASEVLGVAGEVVAAGPVGGRVAGGPVLEEQRPEGGQSQRWPGRTPASSSARCSPPQLPRANALPPRPRKL